MHLVKCEVVLLGLRPRVTAWRRSVQDCNLILDTIEASSKPLCAKIKNPVMHIATHDSPSNSMPSLSADYLIIGAGVFGASTALHLSQQEASASIILIDRSPFPCPFGASHDINKIIRADYSDKFYCKLALEAQRSWREDPIFRPYYHQAGMVIVDDTGLGGRVIENHKQLGERCAAQIFGPGELKRRFAGIYHDMDLHGVKEIFFNPLSGWAEATSALTKVIEVAVERSVRYVTASVLRLVFDERGACIGVRATDGTVVHASKVILCTGAGTAKLLADSAPSRPDLWVKDRLIAAGVCTAAVKLTEAQVQRFKDVPVLVHEVSNVLGTTPTLLLLALRYLQY